MERVGGIIYVKIDGATQRAKGAFSYDLGAPKRDAVVGVDGVHGYKEMPKSAYIEGEITDSLGTDIKALCNVVNSTVTCELANGKTLVFREAFYTGDGVVSSEEGNMKVRFDSPDAEEI